MTLGRLLSWAFALVLCLGTAARAADTGSVSGAVFDKNGGVVAEATVKIAGDRLPGGRTAKTDANGMYTFSCCCPAVTRWKSTCPASASPPAPSSSKWTRTRRSTS